MARPRERKPSAMVLLGAVVGALPCTTCTCDGAGSAPPLEAGGPAVDAAVEAKDADSATTPDGPDAQTAADAGADAPPWDGSWLGDPSIWEPVPTPNECDLHQAKLPSDKVPRREWKPCGEGCLVADAALPGQKGAYRVGTVATEHGGEIYYHVTSAAPKTVGLEELWRLSDDTPLVVLRHSQQCFALSGFDSPAVFLTSRWAKANEPLPPYIVAVAGFGSVNEITWPQPPMKAPSSYEPFDLDGGWGLIDNYAAVGVALNPGSTELTWIYASGGTVGHPAARGSMVVWVDWTSWSPQNRARLRRWTAADGTVVLASGPGDAHHPALSDTKLVWLNASGLDSFEGKFETTTFYWSPLTSDPAKVQLNEGPLVPDAAIAPSPLVTYGDLASVAVGYLANGTLKQNLVIANLVTKQLWSIPARPGNLFGDPMAMNDKTLLIQEFSSSGNITSPERIVQLDLTKLDDLAKGWQ